MMTLSLVILCLGLLPIVFSVQGATGVPADAVFTVEELSQILESAFECHDNPAMAVSVVKDGQILFSKGFGVTNLEDPKPVTGSTLFGIASVSKGFAATLLVKLLYEKTDLTVDSRVKEFLGERFQMPDKVRTEETTFADLMGHKMAVPPNNRMRFDTNLTRDTLIDRLHLLPSPDQFRVKYYYSNLMYGLVTRLAELIGQDKWEDLVTEHLFQPLGMNKSTFATTVDFGREDIAKAYIAQDDDFVGVSPEFSRRWAELAGSGSVVTSADDMVKWMNFHLNGGHNDEGENVVNSKHLAEVHKPRFLISATASKDTRKPQFPVTANEDLYAHGFRVGFYRGYERLSHSGSTLGYRAFLSLLPEQKIGVFTALSGNDDSYKFRAPLHFFLMDWALGLEPWLNVSTICSYPEPWKEAPKPSAPLDLNNSLSLRYDHQEYEGTYYNKAYGYLHLSYNETLSSLVMSYGWGEWQLIKVAADDKDDDNNANGGDKEEKMYGKALGITAITINPVYLITNTSKAGKVTVSVKPSGFEPKVPPVFGKGEAEFDNNNAAGILQHGNCHVLLSLLLISQFMLKIFS